MLGIDLDTPLNEDELNAAISSIAKKVVDRRLEMPAVLLLEMHKPLSFIISQSAVVAIPLLGPLVGVQRIVDFSKIMRNRENIDRLISRIEDMAAKNDETKAESAKTGE